MDKVRSFSSCDFPFYSAYCAAIDLEVSIPAGVRWPELGDKRSTKVDISYGDAYNALADICELGFKTGLRKFNIDSVACAVKSLKRHLETVPQVCQALQHPEDERLSFLDSVMDSWSWIIVDHKFSSRPDGVDGAETWVMFFADDQID
ncbi:hypothetical protein N7449_011034 [Penicillium cf. viridicatum]|uniref:Uncharacterized protein n=1 Tax=Penicillium cf. viridicatum TaxID=2972119 RepID=A0A9W9J0P2_9EURO|nr:hypothetical protein N7449_011034 [Penicillium cf. viridicatum]